MKRFLYFLFVLSALFTAACSDEQVEVPSMRFERRIYSLTSSPVEVKLFVAQKSAEAKVLPVVFEGTAVRGQDYKVSADKFVVGGNSEVLSITITPLRSVTTAKTVVIRLADDASVTTIIDMSPRPKLLYSFLTASEQVGTSAEVALNLFSTETGKYYNVEEKTPVELEVDPSSTAVEGRDFELVNSTDTIRVGSHTAKFSIKILQRDAHRNLIVLRPKLSEADHFYQGRYPVHQLNIITSYAYEVEGEWVMNKFEYGKKAFIETWGSSMQDSEYENIPDGSPNDSYTFTRIAPGKYQLTTSLESYCKHYFQPTAVGRFDGEYTLRVGMGRKTKVQIMKVDNVNRYFSATQQSTDREGWVGLRNYVDPDTKELLLDVYLFDYEPKDFLPSFTDYGMFNSKKPVLTDSGTYLRFTLKRKH